MKDRELLKALELKLMSNAARIKDLEYKVASLEMQLAQNKELLAEKK